MSRIIRVFPRRTTATPDDDLVIVKRGPDMMDMIDADEVHISVAFTWDLPRAEELAKEWESYGLPVKIGGPATGECGGDFVPGRYLKFGNVITSRGCPNHCWFCQVWRREGSAIRELPVTEGWNLLDDNILACSPERIRKVFLMLKGTCRKHHQPVTLTGGLEARRVTPKIAELLDELRPKRMFFAYDTPDDYEPLVAAGKLLKETRFTPEHCHCYVLCGYKGDTPGKAIERFIATYKAGFLPMAMVYRDNEDRRDNRADIWRKIPHTWSRPPATKAELKKIGVK